MVVILGILGSGMPKKVALNASRSEGANDLCVIKMTASWSPDCAKTGHFRGCDELDSMMLVGGQPSPYDLTTRRVPHSTRTGPLEELTLKALEASCRP